MVDPLLGIYSLMDVLPTEFHSKKGLWYLSRF